MSEKYKELKRELNDHKERVERLRESIENTRRVSNADLLKRVNELRDKYVDLEKRVEKNRNEIVLLKKCLQR